MITDQFMYVLSTGVLLRLSVMIFVNHLLYPKTAICLNPSDTYPFTMCFHIKLRAREATATNILFSLQSRIGNYRFDQTTHMHYNDATTSNERCGCS